MAEDANAQVDSEKKISVEGAIEFAMLIAFLTAGNYKGDLVKYKEALTSTFTQMLGASGYEVTAKKED